MLKPAEVQYHLMRTEERVVASVVTHVAQASMLGPGIGIVNAGSRA